MYKVTVKQNLRFSYRPSSRRPAFSLAELVVAVGILVLMMSLAGQVFNFTVQSTGQALALTDINRQLRMLEELLREDLKTVQPGQSMIFIQSNPTNAYWTEDDREADADNNPMNGYDHEPDPQREREDGNIISPRADLLMIFTSRQSNSFVNPSISSHLQQVVYGHADLGEYIPNPNYQAGPGSQPFIFNPGLDAFPINQLNASYPDPQLVSPIPAQQWHLARRNVLLLSTPPTEPTLQGVVWWNKFNNEPNIIANLLADPRLLQGEFDVVGDFAYEQLVLTPYQTVDQWYLPKVFGDMDQKTYAEWDKPFERSQLDPTPPAFISDRLGHYLISNCASFKVEWTLNPRSEFVAGRLNNMKETYWFDPGAIDAVNGMPNPANDDPLKTIQEEIDALKNSNKAVDVLKHDRLKSLLADLKNHSDNRPYSLANRFRSHEMNQDLTFDWTPLSPDKRANMIAFMANLPKQFDMDPRPGFSTIEDIPDDMFPTALRITVDVFDREGRLDRPIRHVMVIPVGG